ncbi:MAG TPA: AraC family transcriptional regulator [Polyangiaceae bacterium]
MVQSPADGTISVLVLRALVSGAAATGLSFAALVESGAKTLATIEPSLLADPDARVSARAALELWELLPRLTRNDGFGLWLAELVRAAPVTAASWLVLSSPTLDEGLAEAVRFQRLLHDRASGELVRSERETAYIHRVGDATFRAPRHAIEFGFAQLVYVVRRATGLEVTPSFVRFQHAEPASLDRHRRVFGTHIVFDAEDDAIGFDRSTLDLPVLTADPALGELVTAHARTLLAELPENTTWTARVQRALGALLPRTTLELDAVAASLSMTRRTLQRRLRDEGTSFEDVVDGLRRNLAERYLGERRLGVQETAFLLGYSDVSAFHRAFVRWTGTTPGQFRDRLAG